MNAEEAQMDDETGVRPQATDGEPHDGGGGAAAGPTKEELEAARAAEAEKEQQENDNELARRRAARGGGSMAQRGAEDEGEDDDGEAQQELPLNIPGAKKARTTLRKGKGAVSVEGKIRGRSVKLGGVVDDPDKLVELRVFVRLAKNEEVPVRDGSDESAETQSIILRQHFTPIRIEVVDHSAAAPAASAG